MEPRQHTPLPPAWADRFLRIFCPTDLQEELLGDLHEQFEQQVADRGEATARRLYIGEVIRFCRPYFIRRQLQTGTAASYTTYSSPAHRTPSLLNPLMLRSNLKIAFSQPVETQDVFVHQRNGS